MGKVVVGKGEGVYCNLVGLGLVSSPYSSYDRYNGKYFLECLVDKSPEY